MRGFGLSSIYKFSGYSRKNGDLLWTRTTRNRVVVEGLNDILTKYFKGVAYTATPFIGLVNDEDFAAIASTDTAAKITDAAPSGMTNGWKEINADYDEATRGTLTLGAVTGGLCDNSASPAEFTFNADVDVRGAFLISDSAKAGVAGKLYGVASYSSLPSLSSGQVLTVTITLSAVSL